MWQLLFEVKEALLLPLPRLPPSKVVVSALLPG